MVCGCLPIYKKLLASVAMGTGKMLSSFRSRLDKSRSSRAENASYMLEEAEIRLRSSQRSNSATSKEGDDV